MGGASSVLAAVPLLAAALGSEAERGGLLRTSVIDDLIASGLSLRRLSVRFPLHMLRIASSDRHICVCIGGLHTHAANPGRGCESGREEPHDTVTGGQIGE